jgi:hypothetical protein
MAEPQTATEGRVKSGAEAARGGDGQRGQPEGQRAQSDGQRAQAERTTWAEPAARASEGAREQVVAAQETASEMARDLTSTTITLYARNMEMASRRGRALADYCDDLARARQPVDVVNAAAGYWSRLISDYSSFAMGEASLIRDQLAAGARTQH